MSKIKARIRKQKTMKKSMNSLTTKEYILRMIQVRNSNVQRQELISNILTCIEDSRKFIIRELSKIKQMEHYNNLRQKPQRQM